jgi:hypothetical protein
MLFLFQVVLPSLKHLALLCLQPLWNLVVNIIGEKAAQNSMLFMNSLVSSSMFIFEYFSRIVHLV